MCHGYYRTYSLPVTMMRFSAVRGAGEAVEAFLFYLSKMKERLPALEPLWEGEEKLILIRDQEGNSWKDHMVDVRDLVHGLIGALDKAETFGQVFHLRDPEHLHGKRWSRISASPLEIPYIEASLDPAFRYVLDL